MLRKQTEFLPPNPQGEALPTFIIADHIEGETERETELRGNVEIRHGTDVLKADNVLYKQGLNEALAKGNVSVYRAGDRFTGPELFLKLDSGEGYFLETTYALYRNNGYGTAKRIDFLGQGRMKMTDVSYSTCPPEKRDWYLSAASIETDQQTQEGEAKSAVVHFMEVPILAAPSFSFPLSDERKSGFLSPSFGATNKGGAELMVPYYWNIAPQHDMTLYPKIIAWRGTQLGADLRYLEPTYSGDVKFEYLPNDRLAERDRYSYTLTNAAAWKNGLSVGWDLNHVSDDQYFRDLSSNITGSSQQFLPRDIRVNYAAGWWNAGIRTISYQTLQDPLAPVTEPYGRLPQVTWSASKQDVVGTDIGALAEFTRFTHPTLVEGDRFVVAPALSYPWQTPGGFIKPKVTLHYTHYNLDQMGTTQSSASRTVPLYSLDSGLVFEREMSWFGKDAQQTLEPRLYYLYVPYRNQDALPNFDSGLSDFNFAQIFSENIFSGSDRIADANQITAALSTRVLDAQSGGQIVRVVAGQRFSFEDARVFLPGQSTTTTRRSDFLFSATGQVNPALLLDFGSQYNPAQKQVQKTSTSFHYQPEPHKVVSGTYRYTRDSIEQVDFSGQWPLSKNWSGVGRVNYDMRASSMIETVVGLEYDSCCWVFRMVAQRFAVATQNATTAFFLQLELKGMGGFGNSPKDLLQRSIPGYAPFDSRSPARPRPVTGDAN